MCNLSDYPGAKEKLKEWRQSGHKIVLITARCKEIREKTVEMVNRLFPGLISEIEFVNPGQSKIELMRKHKIDVWVDDSPVEIKNSIALKIKTFLICNEFTSYNHHWKLNRSLDDNFKIARFVSNIENL